MNVKERPGPLGFCRVLIGELSNYIYLSLLRSHQWLPYSLCNGICRSVEDLQVADTRANIKVNGNSVQEPLGRELSDIGRRSLSSSFRHYSSSFRSNLCGVHLDHDVDNECQLNWAQVERLPTFERLRSSLFDKDGDTKGKRVIDVTMLSALERQLFIEKLIKHVEHDNLRLLQKLRERIDKVGVKFPTVEIRYKNLHVEADCEVVHGKPLPSLWNSLKSMVFDSVKVFGLKSEEAMITVLDNVSGVIKPGRITLLLGPPGCGKTSFLKALSGNLDKDLKVAGEISYNGYKLEEFIPQKTSAYISQNDVHISEMTVRETLDFSAHCQGVGSRAEIMVEVSRKEKELGIIPELDIDTFMKAISVEGQKTTLQTNYILKILGLDICADTVVGNAMRRGISGGQKKRLTTGEMLAGPITVLLMDEISNGLDSSTTYQIVASLQQLAHISDATIVVGLLQPAPEVFDLFDDIILMSEGKIVYHGPRNDILEFIEDCGFMCPQRKGVADFLQEVLSRKDQAQYWHLTEQAHIYVPVNELSRKFKESRFGKTLNEELLKSFVKSQIHTSAISFSKYSLSKWALLRACMSREILLMKRNYFLYAFKSTQLFIVSSIAMTVFLRTRMRVDVLHANYYLGALFYGLVILFFDSMPEMAMTLARLEIFYKQRNLYLYPAWAYAIPAAILKIPVSLLQSLIWTCLTYYVIGYSPEVGRFFRQFLLFFSVHSTSMSFFRFSASVFRTVVATSSFGNLATIFFYLLGGFIIPKPSMPVWLKWGFWISPMTYGEIGLAVNEFGAPRWHQVKMLSTNTSIGKQTLTARGLDFNGYFVWISVGALFGLSLLFNLGFTLALTFLDSPRSRAIISSEKLSQVEGRPYKSNNVEESCGQSPPKKSNEGYKGRTILPFKPLTVVFQDVQYYINTPQAMKERGFSQKKLQLLCDITGALKPGVLTALMGVSGAGKTTLLDVLSGRKTTGTIEGEIRIGGYPKVQQTFSRISGYCEQTDINSPELTVEESVIFSAWLRLDPRIDSNIKYEFVQEVLEIIELDEIKDSLVGTTGFSGLSTEQRKRLTIAVELVANPSIIFMDEPTTGLDARAAAIVMRAVKNVADTGRTIVCTIHQPSIDIFESFDELILLKSGGHVIYSGQLGQHCNNVIEYFESITGVPKIRSNYNPATWMLEVTSTSSEVGLGVDFAHIYKTSNLYESNRDLAMSLSSPPSGSTPLSFPTRFSQNAWGQYTSCLWKMHLSYWRSPSYNLKRLLYTLATSLFFGAIFGGHGRKINNQEDLFIMFGSTFVAVVFLGVNNCSSVIPYVSTERTVVYRERFAGMYASCAYTLAQVTIEIPYNFIQALTYVVITYPMIGYYWSVYKVFWYFYIMFCTMLYYTYLGMLLVSITPGYELSSILQGSCYVMFSLFSGFILPKPQIPKWWIWLYYLVPSSWTLNAMLTSQYGDMEKEIMVFGEMKTVADFLRDYFGYRYDQLPFLAIALTAYPVIFASLFSFFIGKLNFQKR